MNPFLCAGFLMLCRESPGTAFETFLVDVVISELVGVWLYFLSQETPPDFFLNPSVTHTV